MRGSPLLSLFLLLFSLGAPLHAAALRVSADARGPAHDGATWETAFLTIQEALDASHDGDEIWVARTASAQNLVVTQANIDLKGFFAGYETTGVPLGEAPTAMLGTGADLPTISITATATGFRMSGFRVAGASRRGAIRCDATGVTISTNTITNNGVTGGDGGGIVCRPGSQVTISHNLITKNKARHGAGIQARGADVAIINNVIEENEASYTNAGQPDEVGDYGGGVFVLGGAALIKNNEIAFNTVSATAPAEAPDTVTAYGAGIALVGAAATVTNNTVAFNKVLRPHSSAGAAGAGGGIYFTGSGVVANNIVAFNEVNGLGAAYTDGGLFISPDAQDAITVATNLFHSNIPDDSADYAGAGGNLSADPKFVGPGQFFYNFRLQPGSPARDAGDDSWVQTGDLDQNGQQRIRGLHVDMGAYEAVPAVPSASRIHVRPGGSDSADGLTWATAKATIAEALARVEDGGEVWVAAGTYRGAGLTLNGVALYGGFAGTETAREQRDPRANVTVLDAEHKGNVVIVPPFAPETTVLDGFTVQNGEANHGGGVWLLEVSRAVISNNVIRDNAAIRGGGIMVESNATPTIARNVIHDNEAAGGGGIEFWTDGRGVVKNNVLYRNTANFGPGIFASAAYTETPGPFLYNNTIMDRVEVWIGNPVLTNNILGANASPETGRWTFNLFTAGGQAPTDADGNIFNPSAGFDVAYHLGPNSPAINAGDNAVVAEGDTDLDGRPRIVDGRVDIGAFEYVPSPTVEDAATALRIAAGLTAATPDILSRLNVDDTGASKDVVDIADAVRLMRTVGE